MKALKGNILRAQRQRGYSYNVERGRGWLFLMAYYGALHRMGVHAEWRQYRTPSDWVFAVLERYMPMARSNRRAIAMVVRDIRAKSRGKRHVASARAL